MINITDYWAGQKPKCVLTVVHDPVYRQIPVDKMVATAVQSLKEWGTSEANLPPVFFPDYGTIVTAAPWGGQVEIQQNGEIFIHPVTNSIDKALDIKPGENLYIDLAVNMYNEICQKLGQSNILFRSPSLASGPLNTAALILNQEELMSAMHTAPTKVHKFLDRVCDSNINYLVQVLEKAVRVDGDIWPYIWLPRQFGVVITEDMMPLLSAEDYKEFGIPYLKRISDKFGGIFIHCCGEYGRHIRNIAESGVNILGMELHYPFTRIEEIQEYFDDVVIVPFLADFKTGKYKDFTTYLDDLLKLLCNNNTIWVAVSDNPCFKVKEIIKVISDNGIEIENFYQSFK